MGPTIQRGIAIAVAEVAASQGADRAALLALLGPDLDAERVPIERLYAMWELAMRSTRCVALPVRVAAAARFDRYGALGMAIYVSRSMKVAIHRLCQYSELLTDSGHWRSRVEGDDLVITWAREGERTLGHRAANEHALASLATVGRQLYPATTIREVRLRHHLPAGLGEHERHFGAPVIGGASEDAVVFPLSYVSQQPPGADPHVERFILAQVEAAIGATHARDGIAASVARTIIELLPDGAPTLAEVAKRLQTSERTLRRRLAADATSFEQLTIELQRERALVLLAGAYPIAEVALAVGFRDASAFSRAFRRWTGRSPSDARRGPAPR